MQIRQTMRLINKHNRSTGYSSPKSLKSTQLGINLTNGIVAADNHRTTLFKSSKAFNSENKKQKTYKYRTLTEIGVNAKTKPII